MAQACVEKVVAAAQLEQQAISLDRQGSVTAARGKYSEAATLLQTAAESAATVYPEDVPSLQQHRKELLVRSEYLASVKEGEVPGIPLEQHVHSVQLTMQAAGAEAAADGAKGMQTIAAAAGIGAIGGAIVLGGLVGTAAAVVAGGAGMAYASTRQGVVGDSARGVGNMALAAGTKAKQINEEHKISEKATEVGKAVIGRAQEVDSQYQISNKAKVGISKGLDTAKSLDQKYQVTDKVAGGLAKGLDKARTFLAKKQGTGDGSSSSSPTPTGNA